jgi:hypothetical protein
MRLSELIIVIVGIMKAKEPPTIVGKRVPKVVCRSVLMPDTNKIV